MKKILLLLAILSVSVMTTACINNLAIQELNNKAVAYMDKGDAETAVCRLKSSLELDDEVFQTHYNLAVAYNSLGKYDETVGELKRVLELNPDFADAYYTLAVAKEAAAYSKISETLENGSASDLTMQQIEEYNSAAEEVIEDYNKYLGMKPDAKETSEVNAKINELNSKIKEYSDILVSKQLEGDTAASEDVSEEAPSGTDVTE